MLIIVLKESHYDFPYEMKISQGEGGREDWAEFAL